jgi:feruloyl esterase
LPLHVIGSVWRAIAVALCLGLAACAANAPAPPEGKPCCCAPQTRSLPAELLSLPNGGVTVTSAMIIPAATQTVSTTGRTFPATPAYCRLLGHIAPVDPAAPKIHFQLNLPAQWNRKALQFGGSGFNGVVVTGLAAAPLAPPDAPLPISRGYATFGTDSGHPIAFGVEPQAFALNDEALENFAFAAYKKTRDAAIALIQAYYGARPERTYYVGSGEGGREGLVLAQRYPADYDGIYAGAPLVGFVGLHVARTRMGVVQRGGGWLNPRKLELLSKAVLKACDGLDGLNDGIVSHHLACPAAFELGTLRCAGGADAGDQCLSDAQIATVRTVRAPLRLGFALANGLSTYPGWGLGAESNPAQWDRYVTGEAPPPPSGGPHAGPREARNWLAGSGVLRYFIARDAAFDPATLRPELYRARMQRLSSMLDATQPDLSAFQAWGGKLIVHAFTNDHAQSPYAALAYFDAMQRRMSPVLVDQFARLYVTPGANHAGFGPGVPTGVDVLALLEQWVEHGKPPADAVVQTLQSPAPPFAVQAARPMCRHPAYARYKGAGDPRLAASFQCAPVQP